MGITTLFISNLTVVWVEISEKNINFSSLKSFYHRLANRKKIFLPLEKHFKTWTTCSLMALPARNFLSHLQLFKLGEIMLSKYGYLMLPRVFRDIQNYPWNWFYRWSNSSVLCSSCKNTFVGAGNLQVITNKFSCENLWGPYVLYLDPVLCIVLVS